MPKFKKIYYLFSGLIFLVGLIYVLGFSPWFKIQKISCELDQHACDENLLGQLRTVQGKSLLTPKLSELIVTTLKNNYEIDQLTLFLPGTVQISLVTNASHYFLQTGLSRPGGEDQKFLVNNLGQMATAGGEESSAAAIIWSRPPSDFNYQVVPNFYHRQFLNLTSELKKQSLTPDKIELRDEIFILTLADQKQVLLNNNAELKTNLAKLAVILNKKDSLNLPTDFNEIDLRFRLPVLRITKTQF